MSAIGYQQVAQEFEKWSSLPYAEGNPRLRMLPQLQEAGYLRLLLHRSRRVIRADHQALLPSFMTGEAFNRPRRMIALLATVEAIRMHAAANRNALPAKLSAITAVPVPLDPATGKSFQYALVDGKPNCWPRHAARAEHSGRRIAAEFNKPRPFYQ